MIGLYAILQHYDLDPVSFPSPERPKSTTGNAIFSSAILVMTIPITLALAFMGREVRRSWLAVLIWGSLVTVQLLAIVFMLSRGPWIGLGAGLLIFLALAWKLFGSRSLGKHILLLGLTSAVTLAIVLVPAVWSRSEDGESLASAPLVQRGGSIAGEVVGASATTRLSYWWNAADLMVGTPWFEFESDSFSFARPVLGYGPAMFRYAAPLSSSVPTQASLQGHPTNAHNYIIHEWVELGLLGALSYVGLLASIFTVGAVRLFRNRESFSPSHQWILVILLAALGGRVVEQMTGVSREADLALFWALLAVFVALPTVMRANPAPRPMPAAPRKRRMRRGQRAQWGQWDRAAARLLLALTIMGLLGALTWVKNVNYATASWAGASAVRQIGKGEGDRSLQSIDRALELAPDNVNYHGLRAGILTAIKESTTDDVLRQLLTLRVYEARKEAVAIRPLSDITRLGLANAAQELALEGQEALGRQAIEELKVGVALLPGRWPPLNELASGYLRLGQPEEALEVLRLSLSITVGPMLSQSSPALHLQGLAYLQLDEPEKAVSLLEQSLRFDIDAEDEELVHRILADLYTSLGDEARAKEHANP